MSDAQTAQAVLISIEAAATLLNTPAPQQQELRAKFAELLACVDRSRDVARELLAMHNQASETQASMNPGAQQATAAPGFTFVWRHDQADFDPTKMLQVGIVGVADKDWVSFNDNYGLTAVDATGDRRVWRYEVKTNRVQVVVGGQNFERRVKAPLLADDVKSVVEETMVNAE